MGDIKSPIYSISLIDERNSGYFSIGFTGEEDSNGNWKMQSAENRNVEEVCGSNTEFAPSTHGVTDTLIHRFTDTPALGGSGIRLQPYQKASC